MPPIKDISTEEPVGQALGDRSMPMAEMKQGLFSKIFIPGQTCEAD